MKCKFCGKDFLPINKYQTYCSDDCGYTLRMMKTKLKSKIDNIAKNFNFDVKNKDKIINAKILLFKDGDIYRCPCDADNPDRYCGSARCIADVVYKGHCHCSLFWSTKEPLLKEDNKLK